jgi:hypothetical protein
MLSHLMRRDTSCSVVHVKPNQFAQPLVPKAVQALNISIATQPTLFKAPTWAVQVIDGIVYNCLRLDLPQVQVLPMMENLVARHRP